MDAASNSNSSGKGRRPVIYIRPTGSENTGNEVNTTNGNAAQINQMVALPVPSSQNSTDTEGVNRAAGNQNSPSKDTYAMRRLAKPSRSLQVGVAIKSEEATERPRKRQISSDSSSSSSGRSCATLELNPFQTTRATTNVQTRSSTRNTRENEEARPLQIKVEDNVKKTVVRKATRRPETSRNARPKVIAKRTGSATQQKRKRNYDQFFGAIHRTNKKYLKQHSLSKRALVIMNDLLKDVSERLALEARQLMKSAGRRRMTARDIHYAVMLAFPGSLASLATSCGNKALQTYANSLKK